MGMAASQVRFLSLQNRKNTIGLNLMTLSNRKTALSRDMNRIAAEYNDAMNKKVLKWSNNSGVTYSDINYDLLMKPGDLNAKMPYIITDAQGRVVLDDNEIVLPGQSSGMGITYRDLAMMISAYSGTEEDGTTRYSNIDRLQGGNNLTEDNIGYANGVTKDDKATSGLGCNEQYKIATTTAEDIEPGLRYHLMSRLGIITGAASTELKMLNNEIFGEGCRAEGPYTLGSLKGQYYLAKMNLETYKDFLAGEYNYSIGSEQQDTFTTTRLASDYRNYVEYTNTVNLDNTTIEFEIQDYDSDISKLLLNTAYTGKINKNEQMTYIIDGDFKAKYTYTVSSLSEAFGDPTSNNLSEYIDNIKNSFIEKNKTKITIDQTAANKAANSTYLFFHDIKGSTDVVNEKDNLINTFLTFYQFYHMTNEDEITKDNLTTSGYYDSASQKLTLNYTDSSDNNKTKELIISSDSDESEFATYISAKPVDITNDLQDEFDKAAEALNDKLAERDKLICATVGNTNAMDYFDALFKKIAKCGWVYDENVNNPNDKEASQNYLNAKLENNMYFISEVNTVNGVDFNYATKLARDISQVFEVYDTDAQNVALSKYESDKADISSKEKLLDIRINKLETEQDTITAELESIKTIIKDNVSSTFKIFN